MTKILSTSDIWVVYYPGMTSIDKVYLDKELADIAAKESDESCNKLAFSDMFPMRHVVKDLYDAIDLIKDTAVDDVTHPHRS